MIKFDKVSKSFGEITALEGVEFEIGDDEFVFITGPSGSGKTTLFNLLLRHYLPTEGLVSLDGKNLKNISKKEMTNLRRQIGVVFQDLKLLTDRTVYENIAIALKVLGKKDGEIKKDVVEVLDLVGLTNRAFLFPAQLAGGEMQRVALARAVVGKPKIILADEPTGNLDPTTSWQIVKLLKKINRMGKTVIMSTHNIDVVNSMEERVIELDHGKLVSDKKKGKYTTR